MSQPLAIKIAEQAMQEFLRRWHAGLQPCLLLETQINGEIFVSSRVTTPPPQQTEQDVGGTPAQGQRHPRRQGPAHLCRRARHSHEREVAANAASNNNSAAQAAVSFTATTNVAVQAVMETPPHV